MKTAPPVVRITQDGMRKLAEVMINPTVETVWGKDFKDYVINTMVSFGIVLQEQLLGPPLPEQTGLFDSEGGGSIEKT